MNGKSLINECYFSRSGTSGFWLVAVVFLLSSCSNSTPIKVHPPFLPNGEIGVHELTYIQTKPSGMTGHYQLFAMWGLDSTEQKIDFATSSSHVRNNLYWLKERTDELAKSLKFFEGYDEYRRIQPDLAEILNAPDLRYAFSEFETTPYGVGYSSIWICSPKAKKIAFLSAY
jgi:hypothetical protein